MILEQTAAENLELANRVRSVTSRLRYSLTPFCISISSVAATPSNSTLVTCCSQRPTA